MKIIQAFQTKNRSYKKNQPITPVGIMVHSTGANNPNLKRYVQPDDGLLGVNPYGNHFNTLKPGGRSVCVHAFIGKLKDGSIATYQIMPWNWVAWHSGGGSKGYAYNMGYIGFEICEDGLTDKNYFEKVYKEACEITAYLCDMYNIDPHGTVDMNGVKVPTILCHADSYKLGLGSNHGDVNHWFPKHGKSMATVRDDVADLMGKKTSVIEPVKPEEKEMYRVRKTWEDAKSQVGAYTNLDNAKKACDKAGKDYEVYNSKGVAVYPEEVVVKEEVTRTAKKDKPSRLAARRKIMANINKVKDENGNEKMIFDFSSFGNEKEFVVSLKDPLLARHLSKLILPKIKLPDGVMII